MNKRIATLRRNETEEVRIGLDEYKGYDLVSIRVWGEADNKRGIDGGVHLQDRIVVARPLCYRRR